MSSIRSSPRRSSWAQTRARSEMPTSSKRVKVTPTLELSTRPIAPFPLAATLPIPGLGTLLEGSPPAEHEIKMKEVLEMSLEEDQVNEVNESARVRLVWEAFGAFFDGSETGNRLQQGYTNENPALYEYALDSLQYYAQHVCKYEQRIADPSSPPLIQFKHINSEATPYIIKLRQGLGNGVLQVLMTGGNPWVASSARRMWRKPAEFCDGYGAEVVVEGIVYGIVCRIVYGPRKVPAPAPALSAPAPVPTAQLVRSQGQGAEDLENRKGREDKHEDEDNDKDEMEKEKENENENDGNEMDDAFQEPEDVDQALDLTSLTVPVNITPAADDHIRELEIQLAATRLQIQDVKQERNEALQTLGQKDLLLEQVQESFWLRRFRIQIKR
ncbi:hypothetical protein QFC20_002683 [Naganishia adeliensis]|uniref:Uncharacterized protein n=1 Tax=Naganishia adeliensis TaxID=92952 RepID=A0ACC2WHC3_9TREE|nr:hypothetical protein QFC20_002683 [Naganishia adeliensis]